MKLSNLSLENNWKLIREIKSRQLIQWVQGNFKCGPEGLYNGKERKSLVTAVEKDLKVKSSELTFKNMTTENLKTAAEMFIYLNTCPYGRNLEKWFLSWYNFYIDIFQYKPKDEIILTLSRLMNSRHSKNSNIQIWNEKLFRESAIILSLKYDEINNESVIIEQHEGEF